jgi:type I restriction enzyme M protein
MTDKEYKPTEELEAKEGYVRDFLTNRLTRLTPEEQVRQIMLMRLIQEFEYPKDWIKTEFGIQKGSKRIGPADIVVFKDEKSKDQENIWIIVETKRKERSDGIEQLKSYLAPCLNAKFGIWFNGNDITYIEVVREGDKFKFKDVLKIPKCGETTIHLPEKKDLKPAPELKSIFETCHNYIYANEGLLKEKVFNEVLKLIFIKMVDEKKISSKCEFGITTEEEEEIKEGKPSAFTDRIKKLFEEVKLNYSDVFDPNERINLKPITLAFVVSQLQEYSLIETRSDVKGTAFQTFVYAHQRGERGEFFTPHPIVELTVEMLDPKDDEKFIDPACGSGSFLVSVMNYVKEKFIKERPEKKSKANEFLKEYAHAHIAGIDINPDLSKVAKMHMILYDDGHTGIFSANSLSSFEELENFAAKARVPRPLTPLPNSFDILMTNPPFGSKGKITDKRILKQFELGYKWKPACAEASAGRQDKTTGKWAKTDELQNGQVPDILFIERCLQLLKDGGRMAIVLPDGNLNNSSLCYVREFIQQKARILAVISMPVGTFMQSGVNPKTSVLFLQKLNEEELNKLKKENYPIFMAVVEKIGYDLNSKTPKVMFKKDEQGEIINYDNGEPIIDTDIPNIAEAFREFKKKYSLDF